MRFSPVDVVAGKVLNFFVASDVQQTALGTMTSLSSYDYDTTAGVPNGGGAEAVYVRGQSAFAVGRLVCLDKDWNILDLPVTANTGRPVFVVMQAFSATNQYGWVMRTGMFPVAFSVAATVGSVFGGTAGVATPTAAAGRQIMNSTTLIAAASTFTKSVRTLIGSPWVQVLNGIGGLYPGLTPSGTGIPASTISSIEPDNRIRLSANATASGVVTMTLTHTGFGIVHFDRPFIQGQIT